MHVAPGKIRIDFEHQRDHAGNHRRRRRGPVKRAGEVAARIESVRVVHEQRRQGIHTGPRKAAIAAGLIDGEQRGFVVDRIQSGRGAGIEAELSAGRADQQSRSGRRIGRLYAARIERSNHDQFYGRIGGIVVRVLTAYADEVCSITLAEPLNVGEAVAGRFHENAAAAAAQTCSARTVQVSFEGRIDGQWREGDRAVTHVKDVAVRCSAGPAERQYLVGGGLRLDEIPALQTHAGRHAAHTDAR